MKCYQVDACTWYAAETPEEAQKAYLADAGPEVQEYMDEYGDPDEVSLDSDVCDVDEPGQPKHKVSELLVQITDGKPRFIATSEY